jgi:hypothetical protein
VIASGAQQSIHPDFEAWFPNQSHKCVTSDNFIKRENFNNYISKLKPNSHVVIIGGSHSGFSCAWMLLNGAAIHAYEKIPHA